MLLSDRDLRHAIHSGRLCIDPYEPALIQPSSIDLRLDRHLLLWPLDGCAIDPAQEPDMRRFEIKDGETFALYPGGMALASTVERVRLAPDLACRVEGKALALDTAVATPTGWTTMGDIAVGDLVLGADGQPVRVKGATNVLLNRDCYRLRFSNGSEVVADGAHLWKTLTKMERSPRQGGRITTAQSVRTTRDIYATVRHAKELNHWVPTVSLELPERDLLVDPYILGVWLGDGTSSCSDVTLNQRDAAEIVAEVQRRGMWCALREVKRGANKYLVGGRERRAHGGWVSLDCLRTRLRLLGVLNAKHIPTAYLRASDKQRWALLQGLLDTDGYVSRSGHQAELTFTNRRLAEDARELIDSLGISSTWDQRPARLHGRIVGTAYRIRFRPHQDMFVTSFRRNRVRDERSWTQPLRGRHRAIVAVTRVESVPVRCIEVDAGDGMFLITRSFIPTHNSSLARLGLAAHITAGFIDPGFQGHITLELVNHAPRPMLLHPGMRIAQLCAIPMLGTVERPYGADGVGSHYQNQRGPTPSRSWRWRTWPTTTIEGSSL